MSEHTPGPWFYRPNEYDDWGWVRAACDDGIGPLVACARSGQYEDEATLDQHRRDGTDPYGANARLIAAAPNMRDALEAIAGFSSVNLAGEFEGGLRDIIRSMTDCAKRALNGAN